MRLVKGAVERSFEAIGVLAAAPGWMRMSDIADKLELQKGPTHRMLAQLMDMGWVEQNAMTEQYRLTLKLALMGQQYLHNIGLPGLVQPILDALSRQCTELVRLTAVDGDKLVWFGSAQGAAPGLMYQPSMSRPVVLHSTANGKAWLATMPNEIAAHKVLQAGLADMTGSGKPERTIESVLKELDEVRARGYGLSVEDAEPGVTAIAVAVRAQNGQVLGTMSIAGPVMRITPDKYARYHALLEEAASQLGTVWMHHGT